MSKIIATVVRLQARCSSCEEPALYSVVRAPMIALSVILERQELVNRCAAHLEPEEREMLERLER